MSELIVKIRHVTSVLTHPIGDFLEIVQVDNGWECVVKKGEFKCGERVLFIPPDSIIPHSLHTFLGITKFCAHLPSGHPERNSESMRIKAAKVRGIPSFGVVVSLKKLKEYATLCLSPDDYDILEHLSDDCGDLLKVMLKITKYVEPESTIPGEIVKKNDLVRFYHDIERWQNYPNWFTNGEEIVLLEKIHGQNSVSGIVKNERGNYNWIAGSHRLQRKRHRNSTFWIPLYDRYLRAMIYHVLTIAKEEVFSIAVYSEIYGSGIQKMVYDCSNGQKKYIVYDIFVNDKPIEWQEVKYICEICGVPHVPELYCGEYSPEIVKLHTDGDSALAPPSINLSKFKGREGCVIRPLVERFNSLGKRCILKSVSSEYLAKN